jgi:hypothetical protein
MKTLTFFNKYKKRKTHKKKTHKRKTHKRKTHKRNRIYLGGHEHEDLEHYHLHVKDAKTGRSVEFPPVFKYGKKSREITSANIQQLKEIAAYDYFRYEPNDIFLSWKGCKLEPNELKVRDIEVDGERLISFRQNEIPIIVHENGKEYDKYPINESCNPNVSLGYETDDS